ncbi:MAG: hypothetical protein HEQ39_13365 [Rhizobacter sp.]
MSTAPVNSSASIDSLYANTFSAENLLPLKPRGYNSNQGLQNPGTSSELPTFSADKKPGVLPTRPQNNAINAPFNPATDIYESVTSNLQGGGKVTTRYNNGGLLTQPADRGTEPLTPAGQGVKPVRIDATIPIIPGDVISLSAEARLEANQNTRVGVSSALNLGDVKANAGIYEVQALQNVGVPGASRTQVTGGLSVKTGDVTLGVNVVRTSGGTTKQTGNTRIDPSITVNVGGTQIQGGPTFTLDDKKGNTQIGGVISVQPVKPDNTRPYGFGVIKYGENPLAPDTSAFSVTGGLRF